MKEAILLLSLFSSVFHDKQINIHNWQIRIDSLQFATPSSHGHMKTKAEMYRVLSSDRSDDIL